MKSKEDYVQAIEERAAELGVAPDAIDWVSSNVILLPTITTTLSGAAVALQKQERIK